MSAAGAAVPPNPEQTPTAVLSVGDQCEALYAADGLYYPATVVQVDAKGTLRRMLLIPLLCD